MLFAPFIGLLKKAIKSKQSEIVLEVRDDEGAVVERIDAMALEDMDPDKLQSLIDQAKSMGRPDAHNRGV